MSTIGNRPPRMRKERACLLCGNMYGKLQLTATTSSGEVWQCQDLDRCAAKTTSRDGMMADWPCHHAERTELVACRVATGISWREYHRARYERSGDELELIRMERH